MGSGKSTIAELLAERRRLPFLDLDKMIEKEEQMTINSIFEKKGEIYFRKVEHQIFKDAISSSSSFVLSLGGGTPCYANNHLFLKDPSVVSIYLRVGIEELCNRLINEKAHRPLIEEMNIDEMKSFVGQHLFERSYYYNQAGYTIDANGKSTKEIISEIEKLLV